MSSDFKERPLILQPSDSDKSITFSFPACSEATENDGAIPYGTTISSALATIAREDTGEDATSEIIQGTSNTTTTVTVTFTYPTTTGTGTYYLKFVLTLNTVAEHEFDYIVECIDKPLGTFIEKVKAKVKDEPDSDTQQGRLVYPSDYINSVNEALKIYSRLFPLVKVVENTGDGTYDYSLPSDWNDESSIIVSIEYPTGEQIPSYLYDDQFMIYTDLQGDPSTEVKVLRLLTIKPSSGETFRVSYTTTHTITTLPSKHIDAVNNLAASLACEMLASYYGHTSDSLINADSVKYDRKAKDFSDRAMRFYNLYKEQLGMGAKDIVPAAAIDVDWDFGLSDQIQGLYLTHNRRR